MQIKFLIIGIILGIIFIFSFYKVFNNNTSKRDLIVNLVVINFIILSAIACIWRFFDYYSPHRWIEITLPIKQNTSNNIKSVEFCLPKGDYTVFAEIDGNTVKKDGRRKIHYRIEIPNQNFIIDKEEIVDFSENINYIPMDTFDIKESKSRGVFFVEVFDSVNNDISFKLTLSTHKYF